MVFSDEVVFQTKFRATAKLHIRRSEKRDEMEIVTKLPQVGEVALYLYGQVIANLAWFYLSLF